MSSQVQIEVIRGDLVKSADTDLKNLPVLAVQKIGWWPACIIVSQESPSLCQARVTGENHQRTTKCECLFCPWMLCCLLKIPQRACWQPGSTSKGFVQACLSVMNAFWYNFPLRFQALQADRVARSCCSCKSSREAKGGSKRVSGKVAERTPWRRHEEGMQIKMMHFSWVFGMLEGAQISLIPLCTAGETLQSICDVLSWLTLFKSISQRPFHMIYLQALAHTL